MNSRQEREWIAGVAEAVYAHVFVILDGEVFLTAEDAALGARKARDAVANMLRGMMSSETTEQGELR